MPTTEKAESIAEIKERIQNHQVSVLVHYVGINVDQVTRLRKLLRDAGVKYKVYKNTLAKRALDELGLSAAAAFLQGPTAWAFSVDPVAPAKILKQFAKEAAVVGMNGGIVGGRVATKEQMELLAALPPREVLLAQVVGTIAMPLSSFVGVLSAVPRNLVNVLDQVRKQKETQQAA